MVDEEMYYAPVKDWYIATYPTDECGPLLPDTIGEVAGDFFQYDIAEDPSYANQPVTFETYFTVLDNYGDIYDLMGTQGGADSIVRERIFEKLAEIMDVDYGYIYDQWLRSAD